MVALGFENGILCEVYAKAVPKLVDDEGFWFRYFYRIDKAKQVEEARADLVRRAVSGEDDDENWELGSIESSLLGRA
ncbi:hypothetical protein Scep_015464 [Stephania cephalantha]|uniref:BSD domain-containing protein n=1 Tax=Stephania cephalantha TaxID=152367 RepID=A0AAP0J564_9MAGN